VTSEKDDEQYHRSYNFKWKIQGEVVLLPRIPTDMSFEFKRLQFCVRLAFAMTIKKFRKSMILTWTIVCVLQLAHALENVLIYSCTHQNEKKNLYSKALQ
jgi:hypothetical protein